MPYSRYNPQFNQDNLKAGLREHGLKYVFLGEELGARSQDSTCYVDGQARYDLTLWALDAPTDIRLSWNYRIGVLSPDTIQQLHRRLVAVLAAIVGEPDADMATLHLQLDFPDLNPVLVT